MIKKATKEKVIDYVAYFFIYSFLGWIIETIYALIIHGEFIKRGFLFGPLCPIYGFGAIILLLTTKKMYGKPFAKFLIAMGGVMLSSFVIYLGLTIYNKFFVDKSLFPNNDPDDVLNTPKTVDEAVTLFIKRNKLC